MDYSINSHVFASTFALPSDVADKYLKLAKGEHIKVLIYIMRNIASLPSVEKISEETDVDIYDVKEALLFWADAGILVSQNNKPQEKSKTVKKILKPQREDVAKRGLEDPKIRYLLNEAQIKLGRNLKSNETSTLVWLYDDCGMDVSLILLIMQYAISHGNANISFVQSIATDWIDKGIDNLADADAELNRLALGEKAWDIVRKAFGIERRKAGKKEMALSIKWVDEWKISSEMLELAYSICVDNKSKFSIDYVARIIENWQKDGIKTPEDIEVKSRSKEDTKAAYDLDLFEKMLENKD